MFVLAKWNAMQLQSQRPPQELRIITTEVIMLNLQYSNNNTYEIQLNW